MSDKIRTILIDDEMLVRKLIRMKLQTLELGLEIVGEYSSAESALAEIGDLQPDVILSDICMPGTDGILFSQKCRDLLPKARIIIITGYNDFEYVRSSLRAGVFDFLCKPVQTKELGDAMQRAVDAIRGERDKSSQDTQFLEEMRENLPALRDLYLNDIFLGKKDAEGAALKLSEYGMAVNPKAQSGLQIAVLGTAQLLEDHTLSLSMKEESESFFREDRYIYVMSDSFGRTVVISNETEIAFESYIELLVQMMEAKYHCRIMAGVSDRYDGFDDLYETYGDALHAMQKEHGNKSVSGLEQDDARLSGELTSRIRAGQTEEAADVWARILKERPEDTQRTLSQERHFILSRLQKACLAAGIPAKDRKDEACLERCLTLRMLQETATDIVLELAGERAMERDPGRGKIVQDVLAKLSAELSDPALNMNRIAEEFHVSSSNLGRLFRQFTGHTYGECLSILRLRKALLLIEKGEDYDRDIGAQIGIPDPHYMSIWFRKQTGMSMTEYRKRKTSFME